MPEKKKQLYFNVVLTYTDNKVKSKEGKRRNGFAIIFLFTSKIKTNFITFLFSRKEYTISMHLVDNSCR